MSGDFWRFSAQDVSAMKHVVKGILGPLKVPFMSGDACKSYGLTCPLKAGSEYTWILELPIKSIYPAVMLF